MAKGILYDDVLLSAPGNLEAWRVPVAAPQVSWEINNGGAFSAFVRLEDLRSIGLAIDLKGYWISYATEAGLWGGIVTGQPSTNGTVEISGEGFLALVIGRVISDPVVAMSGSAGGLARRALELAGSSGPAFLRIGNIDEGGGPLTMDLAGDVGQDILPQVAEAGDVEWVVGADRVFTLSRRLGTDRSSYVRLVEDVHIVDARLNDDLESVKAGAVYRVQNQLSQDILKITRPQPTTPIVQPPNNPSVPNTPTPPAPAPPVWTPTVPRSNPQLQSAISQIPGLAEFIARRSQRSGASTAVQQQQQSYTVEPPSVVIRVAPNAPPPPWSSVAVGVGANNPAVPGRRHSSPPTIPAELTLANVEGAWGVCDLGDTVRIDLGSIGASGRFRVMNRALDVGGKSLTVSGEFLRDAE